MSREGAFLANNLLFVLFAFVVLLGTVFPLLYEAVNSGAQVAVGAPYFNRLIIPIGLGLLFLMAVAPALPWRKSTAEIMRGRLAVPAAIGVLVVVACVIGGITGIEPLLAFGLGAFAAASAGRALVLSVRGAWRSARGAGASPARATLAGWRGFVGRANGGMVVHIGVVLIAVGLAAATAFGQRGTVVLAPGESGTFAGHTVEFVGTRVVRTPSHLSQQALLRVDGGAVFTPAISQFGTGTQAVGTPAIDSSVTSDVYLTINSIPAKGGPWTFGVVVQPLVMWLWVGGVLIVVGSILSAVPGRRRRPTDPVSTPVGAAAPPVARTGSGAGAGNSARTASRSARVRPRDRGRPPGDGHRPAGRPSAPASSHRAVDRRDRARRGRRAHRRAGHPPTRPPCRRCRARWSAPRRPRSGA